MSAKDLPAEGILHITGAPRLVCMPRPMPSKLNALRNDGRWKGGKARLCGEGKWGPVGWVAMGLLGLGLVLEVVVVRLVVL